MNYEIQTWWQRLGCIRNPGCCTGEEVARDEEIDELRQALKAAVPVVAQDAREDWKDAYSAGFEAAKALFAPSLPAVAPQECQHTYQKDRGGPNDDEVMRCSKCGAYQPAAPQQPEAELKIEHARIFAMAAHEAVGQVRKYSGIPYHTHPEAVAAILLAHYPESSPEMVMAAHLHDVVEDTQVKMSTIVDVFGGEVASLVDGLTNRKLQRWGEGIEGCLGPVPRKEQKEYNASRLASQGWQVKRIKRADKLHNLPDIIANDAKFAATYVAESRHLLDHAIKDESCPMWQKLDTIIKDYYAKQLDTTLVAS